MKKDIRKDKKLEKNGSNKLDYTAPAILSIEPLEVLAVACQPGKTSPDTLCGIKSS